MRKALLIVLAFALVASVFVSCSDDPQTDTVTITFNPGTATGDPYTQTIVRGEEADLKGIKFEYPGYQFVGWAKTSEGEVFYKDRDTVMLNSDITLYAIWAKIYSIEVAKDVTGGTLVANETSYIISQTMQKISLTATPDEGYYHATTLTTGSDNKHAYAVFESLYILQNTEGNILLTPVFKLKTVPVTITFNPGDATGEPYTQSINYGEEAKLTPNAFTRDGYKFIGWSLSPTGGCDYEDEATIKPTSDINLYAVWSQQYSITVNKAEHGTVVASETSYYSSDTLQTVKLNITPDTNYYLDSLSLTGSKNKEAMCLLFNLLIPADSSGDIVITPKFEKIKEKLSYIDATWNDSESKVEKTTHEIEEGSFTPITKDSKKWDAEWYVVTADTEIKDRINVTGKKVNLIIRDGVTLTADKGITVPEGSKLTIYGQADCSGYLKINGVDENNAGIGGTAETKSGTVEIKGGIIVVAGGKNAAGIGGGNEKSAGTVNVYWGGVFATGDELGAGIGGGNKTDGGNITFYGGIVKAQGGKDAAGIGGGCSGTGGTINIYGAIIIAKGGSDGAGIGCGDGAKGGNVHIHGGNVTSSGGKYGAGIGGGYNGKCAAIIIDNGIVFANGVSGGAGIGGGIFGDSGAITISGGTITASGYEKVDDYVGGSGIGGGGVEDGWEGGSAETIIINGGTVIAYGGSGSAGIGGGDCGCGGKITVSGENTVVTAKGGRWGAGIGGGEAYHPISLTFTGGTITAYGGDAAAGIGGGSEGGGGDIRIEGSKTLITATCGKGAEYGIGPGQHVEDGNLSLGSGVHMKISDNGKDWSDYTDKGKKYMKTVI